MPVGVTLEPAYSGDGMTNSPPLVLFLVPLLLRDLGVFLAQHLGRSYGFTPQVKSDLLGAHFGSDLNRSWLYGVPKLEEQDRGYTPLYHYQVRVQRCVPLHKISTPHIPMCLPPKVRKPLNDVLIQSSRPTCCGINPSRVPFAVRGEVVAKFLAKRHGVASPAYIQGPHCLRHLIQKYKDIGRSKGRAPVSNRPEPSEIWRGLATIRHFVNENPFPSLADNADNVVLGSSRTYERQNRTQSNQKNIFIRTFFYWASVQARRAEALAPAKW